MQDRVEVPPAGSGFDLYIFSSTEKPNWRARQEGHRTQAPFPGSAISYEENVYEVISIGPAPGTPYAYRYALRAWEERFAIRQVFAYSLQAAHAETRHLEETRKQSEGRRIGVIWFALTGLLPTPVATRWQRDWGLPMRVASMISIWVLAGGAMAVLSAGSQEKPDPRLLHVLMFVSFEQAVRFLWWMGSSDAIGSLSLSAIWMLWMLATGRSSEGEAVTLTASTFERQRDEVRHVVGSEDRGKTYDVEVRSMLRDPVLLGPAPVRYFGEVYQPLGYTQEGEGINRRYIFRLKKLDPATVARREYLPERTPEHLARLIPYERERDRVNRLSFFCGLLSDDQQTELARRYDYDAGLWTGRTAKLAAVSGAVQLWALRGEHIGPAHLVTGYFFLEGIFRLAMLHLRHDIVGSVLGYLVAPFMPKK